MAYQAIRATPCTVATFTQNHRDDGAREVHHNKDCSAKETPVNFVTLPSSQKLFGLVWLECVIEEVSIRLWDWRSK